jgi:hypothetical protein
MDGFNEWDFASLVGRMAGRGSRQLSKNPAGTRREGKCVRASVSRKVTVLGVKAENAERGGSGSDLDESGEAANWHGHRQILKNESTAIC